LNVLLFYKNEQGVALLLGENIKNIRKSKKMSINKLSKMSGISLGYLSDLENNNAKNPTMEKLQSIATVLEVKIGDLLNSDEKLDIAISSINKIAELAQKGLNYNVNDSDYLNYVAESNTNNDNLMSVVSLFQDEKFSEEEQNEISNFIKYVISKRKK
jgi:transcriptional regulator with XRE-family HTH domain